MISVDVIAGLH